jgi:hypothetical protein
MGKNTFGAKLLVYASVQFVVLTSGAMFLYPGGAMYEPNAKRYLFFQNFFSDLGATLTRTKESNLYSMLLFIVALGSIGTSLAVASPLWKRVIVGEGRTMAFGHAAQALSLLSGICYVGIALTPWNLVLGVHMLFVQGAFTLLLGFVICLTVMEVQNNWPVRYIASNIVYIAILTTYVFVLFHGPNLLTFRGLVFQVIAQKIIVYISILNLAYQCLSLLTPKKTAL